MEASHAESIAKFADAKDKRYSHGALVENSLHQLNRVDSKLHAEYRIVAAPSREVALSSAATPMFDHMSNLAVGSEQKYVDEAREQGRKMSDHFRGLPHFTTRNDLRSRTVDTQKMGFLPEVQGKIEHAQETLFVA
jgi:hypothetical protein